MLSSESLLHNGDKQTLWRKYCGFLDFSLEEFMAIQKQLLLEQIELVSGSPLGKKIMGESKPSSIEEFRSFVPLTTYQDYLPYLEEKREDVLSEKPVCWVHTSGRDGNFKWVPYTLRGYHRLIDSLVSTLILASAKKKGDVHLEKRARIMFHLPPRPYLGGQFAFGLSERIACQPIPPLETSERMSFEERIKEELALVKRHGVDFIFSLPSNLADMGANFADQLNHGSSIPFSISSPRRDLRLAQTKLSTKIKDKPILPHHWCCPRGIICIGADSSFYREEISYYWGNTPYDIYLAAETGCLAFPSWDGATMTFTPFSGFLEFIPEEEWSKGEETKSSAPTTLLLNELEVSKRYELVVTSFYGMPFLRYRLGDVIKVVALKNEEARVSLPESLFESRINDIINKGSLLELSEKKVWQALLNSGLRYQDWFVVSQESSGNTTLHLYVELRNDLGKEMEQLIFGSRTAIEVGAKPLLDEPDIPLKVTILPRGTFRRYYEQKQAAGFDPACFKPVHINPTDSFIHHLISPNGGSEAQGKIRGI
jgi:hypothetical protein